jgi:hypothetical protein
MEAQAQICSISFAEKARVLSSDFLKCCMYISGCEEPERAFTKKLYSKLIGTSQVLEDFLDFHGAKNNTQWYFYRELTAAVRHLSLAGYSQKHIVNRLGFYDLGDVVEFQQQGEQTFNFITSSLVGLAPVVIEEARRLNIPMPVDNFSAADFPGITTGELLDYDIDDESKDVQKRNIVKIASEFLDIAAKFDYLAFFKPLNQEDILALVPDKVNEVGMRRFEMLVHNLQSSFDTYVIHGGFRFGDRKYKQLRSHFSIVLHLLQIMGRLLHFYERHLVEVGYKRLYGKVQSQLSDIVDPEKLLDRTVNGCLYYVCRFLNQGKELAQEILNENIERNAISVGIPVKLGFHSRPSLLVAKIVQHYGGQVELCVGSDRFDASSVLDIQWAGGKIHKENIEDVVFEGDARALKDIEILASVNYGEDTMGKGVPLPKELSYLK